MPLVAPVTRAILLASLAVMMFSFGWIGRVRCPDVQHRTGGEIALK
jgi:hypothetical protein